MGDGEGGSFLVRQKRSNLEESGADLTWIKYVGRNDVSQQTAKMFSTFLTTQPHIKYVESFVAIWPIGNYAARHQTSPCVCRWPLVNCMWLIGGSRLSGHKLHSSISTSSLVSSFPFFYSHSQNEKTNQTPKYIMFLMNVSAPGSKGLCFCFCSSFVLFF